MRVPIVVDNVKDAFEPGSDLPLHEPRVCRLTPTPPQEPPAGQDSGKGQDQNDIDGNVHVLNVGRSWPRLEADDRPS